MLDLNIEKHFDEFGLAVQFGIEAQILALFGASGAGKTMTLNCIAGLLTPDDGSIRLNGRDLFHRVKGVNVPTRSRKIGYVFQNYALFPHLTVQENIGYGVRDSHNAATRVNELLELTHLTELAARYPAQLSGGQQQRVALARALAPRPNLLLLDEPFSALDAPTRMQLRGELRDLQHEFKIPVIFVTHDLGEAYFLADQLAVIDGGTIQQIDAPGEILRRPKNLHVARAVGVKNILRGVVKSLKEDAVCVRIGDVVVDAPLAPLEPGTIVHVCLHPERVTLVRPERGEQSSPENQVHGHLVREMSDGMTVTLFFRAEGARMVKEQDYDLQIELPVYIYERLNLATERTWTVKLRKNAMHLIA